MATLGWVLFLYKVFALGFPLLPGVTADLWRIEARVTFQAKNVPVKVTVQIPHNMPRFLLMDESFVSHGYGLTTQRTEEGRQAVWSIRMAKGYQGLYYRALIRQTEGKELLVKNPPKVEPQAFEEPSRTAAQALLQEVHARSADTESLVAGLLKELNSLSPSESVVVLLGKKPTLREKAEMAVKILGHAGIASRSVHGIRLESQRKEAPILTWMEVINDQRWQAFNVETGESGVPADYFPWWRGDGPLTTVKGAEGIAAGLSVSRVQEPALIAAMTAGQIRKSAMIAFSPSSLPLETQAVYRILFMIPVGAFLLVIFRNVIGVKTFGTFMPVLIALAFRETRLLWGIFLFVLILSFGLSIRLYLEHLKLLLVPRLAAILIVVVILMALFSILSHKLGLERGLSIALFPMVILTMTIERMSIVWEENGPQEALQQGLGSLVVAALAYLVMTYRYTEHLFFTFPELLLVLLAATLLMGRYSGYRLFELFRFKVLAGNKK